MGVGVTPNKCFVQLFNGFVVVLIVVFNGFMVFNSFIVVFNSLIVVASFKYLVGDDSYPMIWFVKKACIDWVFTRVQWFLPTAMDYVIHVDVLLGCL